MHTRTAGEVADNTSNKGQNGESQRSPPDVGVERDTISQSLEHEKQTPLHGPKC